MADVTVTANFAIDTFTLTYTAGKGGSLTGDAVQVVNYGGDGTAVTAVPNTGYHFVNWSDASTANPRTDMNVTANVAVTANFTQTEYILIVTTVGNGTVNRNINPPYYLNDVVNLSVVPDVGWIFSGWSGDCTGTGACSVTMDGNKTVTATFIVEVQLPGSFIKWGPSDGSGGRGTAQALTWGASSGATSYEYCIDTTSGATCEGTWVSTGTSKSVTPPGIVRGMTYYWQVRAVNAGGNTMANAGAWWSYSTQPGNFNRLTPVSGATGVSVNPTLTWGSSAGATSYEYCIDTTSGTTCEGTWISVGNNLSVSLSGLLTNTVYYWQVRSVLAGGYNYANGTTWSSFTTVP
jgi:uncharacterized repeat protein (TIGR02543 family)